MSQDRPSVGFDNQAAAGQIVDYLLDLGHTQISVITGRTQYNERAAMRTAGIMARLERKRLKLHSQIVVEHPYRILEGRLAMRSLMASPERPTAVICGNDQLAFGALIEATALGVKVPAEVSITGFNDLDYAAHLNPPLTTMRVSADEIGAKAGEYILQRLAGQSVIPFAEIDVSLIVRGSTAAPAQRAPRRSRAK
jgi:LacI family transcriptional regulator